MLEKDRDLVGQATFEEICSFIPSAFLEINHILCLSGVLQMPGL